MKLSVLIPAIPERLNKAKVLYDRLEHQIGDKDVEVLLFMDNMKRTIGEKRNDLKNLVNSEYFGFVDDDDNISDDYIDEILKAIEKKPDVVTFKQQSSINGKPFIVTFGLENENEPAQGDDKGGYVDVKRKPFHVCIWKTSLVQVIKFPSKQYGEDWDWAKFACERSKKEIHIDKILHYYNWDAKETRAI